MGRSDEEVLPVVVTATDELKRSRAEIEDSVERTSSTSVDAAPSPQKMNGVERAARSSRIGRKVVEKAALATTDSSDDEYNEEDSDQRSAKNSSLESDITESVDDTYSSGSSDAGVSNEDPTETKKIRQQLKAWRPSGNDKLDEDEELVFDRKAYQVYHRLTAEWSVFTFDLASDSCGQKRSTFPQSFLLVAGTQAADLGSDKIIVMKLSGISEMKQRRKKALPAAHELADDSSSDSSASDSDDESSDDDGNTPSLRSFSINHPTGSVNRLRVCPQLPRLIASWSDSGAVNVWDIQQHWDRLDDPGSVAPGSNMTPKFTFKGHQKPGYGLAFNPHRTGMLATSSRDATVRLWLPVESGWSVGSAATFHSQSVEDVSWKRVGTDAGNILASCSIDRSIVIWDTRTAADGALKKSNAHADDINVVAWSPCEDSFLLSGSDDNSSKVWDIRNLDEPLVHLEWHKGPITSVDWHPDDPAEFAVASTDNSISFWDMSVEAEEPEMVVTGAEPPNESNVPEQLLFEHMGQYHISEVKWHRQIPGLVISTAEDAVNVFKPANI